MPRTHPVDREAALVRLAEREAFGHDPEPWHATGTRLYTEIKRSPIDRVIQLGDLHRQPCYLGGTSYQEELEIAAIRSRNNTRRVVACVNALTGVPTKALEAGAVARALEALGEAQALLDHLERNAPDVYGSLPSIAITAEQVRGARRALRQKEEE